MGGIRRNVLSGDDIKRLALSEDRLYQEVGVIRRKVVSGGR